MPSEFRDAITELAKQAIEEDRRNEETRRRAKHRPVSPVIKIGLMLMALELVSLAVLYGNQRQQITRIAPSVRALLQNDCISVAHQTYWKVLAYVREEHRAPAKLDELVPRYLDRLPVDPATSKPLVYSADGKRFDLHCPSPPARK